MPLFEMDEDFGLAEKILDRVLSLKCDNGSPILPSTKNVKSLKCYEKACIMLWAIYDGTFFKKYQIIERSDYNMNGWKDRIKECEDDWGKVRILVLNSVKHFYKSLYPEYVPQNKKFLQTIKFSNFFETGFNQSMFINCINEPLCSGEFLKNKRLNAIKKDIPESSLSYAETFYKKHIGESKYDIVYWQGIADICSWWKLFKKYTTFAFDVKGNLENGNIVYDYCKFITDYLNRSSKDCNPYWFKIHENEESICDGFFRSYLNTDRFVVAKDLPRRLYFYGCEERFKSLVKPEKSKIKVEIKDENSFIDSLED